MKNKKQGIAFLENIKTEQVRHTYRPVKAQKVGAMRGFLLPIVLLLVFGLLLIKVIGLQIFEGQYYLGLSDANKLQTTIIHAPRGVIFDRNGVPLVVNTPGFRLSKNGKTTFINQQDALSLIANGQKNLAIDSLRNYPYKDATAHVLGYVGQISPQDLSLPQYATYQADDVIGKMGLEEQYEQKLRGVDGKSLAEVDATGKVVKTLGQTDAIPGQNMTTTLDTKLQVAAYNAMKGVAKGAVVVSTPKGEILAMVSTPSFDPNLFTMDKNYKTATDSAYQTVSSILTGKDQPLLNRAVSGTYPPGSTFKLVVAATGLEEKLIDQNYTINDTGTITIGAFSFSNWYYSGYGRTEGVINVVTAIKRSNDIFFYKLAELIGVDRLSAFVTKYFHLGSPTGIDLPNEAAGLVPTKEWKQKTIGEPWYLGDDYHYGIGQGFLLTTPLQVNTWTQAIANGGVMYRPHLLLADHPQLTARFLSDQTVSLIQQGMIQVCNPGGVAYPLFNFAVKNPHLQVDGKNVVQAASSSADFKHVVLACKTGTAEQGDANSKPHAWITIFAPAYNPQIVVTVLSEASGEGSDIAAPIAKKVLEEWFSR